MFEKLLKKAPSIKEKRLKELLLFQNNINVKFDNISLLENALTHSSFANESKNEKVEDNERLEFLGDSILSLIVSEYLFENIPGNEGAYTKIRSVVVSEDTLSKIARKIEIDKFIRVGKGEQQQGGRNKNAILADCMEAVIASIYLDKGLQAAKQFVLNFIIDEINLVLSNLAKKDFKTILQEYVQKQYKIVPNYNLIEIKGPEHNQIFYYEVSFKNRKFGPGIGHNKKEAEQNAAKEALISLGLEK